MTTLDKVTEKFDLKEAFNNIVKKGKLDSLEQNLINFAFRSPFAEVKEEMAAIVDPFFGHQSNEP